VRRARGHSGPAGSPRRGEIGGWDLWWHSGCRWQILSLSPQQVDAGRGAVVRSEWPLRPAPARDCPDARCAALRRRRRRRRRRADGVNPGSRSCRPTGTAGGRSRQPNTSLSLDLAADPHAPHHAGTRAGRSSLRALRERFLAIPNNSNTLFCLGLELPGSISICTAQPRWYVHQHLHSPEVGR